MDQSEEPRETALPRGKKGLIAQEEVTQERRPDLPAHGIGAVPNGAKLSPFWDDFRRPLFDVGGGPFLCGVLSSSGSSLRGVF